MAYASTRFPGVYYLESTKRKVNGRADRCYRYALNINGRKVWYRVGWASEGITALYAAEERKKALARMADTPLPVKKGLTFAEAWQAYAPHLAALRSAKTVRGMVEHRLLPVFGELQLSVIHPSDVESFRNKTLAEGLSAQTVKHLLGYFGRIWKHAAAEGLHQLPCPASVVKAPRPDNERERFLTREEAARLLDALKGSPDWHDLAVMSLATGARLTELRSLRFEHVSVYSKTAAVTGKTGRRVLILNESAIAVLIARGADRIRQGLVFPGHDKDGMLSLGASVFRRAVRRCGLNGPDTPPLQRVVFHTLRHTYASWMAMDGVPLLTIMRLMGHSTIAMTERYSHLCPDAKRKAAAVVSDVLKGL